MSTETPKSAALTPSNPPATAPAKPTLRDWLNSDELQAMVAKALPAHLKGVRFMRVLATQLQKNPKLMLCTQTSLFTALMTCAQWGIEPDGRRAYLIPFKKKAFKGQPESMECQVIIGYQGFAELAYNSGKISNLHAAIVCENDVFEEDMGRVIKHKIDRKNDRGRPYAAWAKAEFKDGSTKFEVMSESEILAIRDKSQGYQAYLYGKKQGWNSDSPWADEQSEPEMWKKTVFLRLKKWIPLSAEIRDLITDDPDTIIEIGQGRGKERPPAIRGGVDLALPQHADGADFDVVEETPEVQPEPAKELTAEEKMKKEGFTK